MLRDDNNLSVPQGIHGPREELIRANDPDNRGFFDNLTPIDSMPWNVVLFSSSAASVRLFTSRIVIR